MRQNQALLIALEKRIKLYGKIVKIKYSFLPNQHKTTENNLFFSKINQRTESLIVHLPNKGCFVITFTEQDIKEVFSLSASLESMAFEWAIPKMTPQDIQKLRDLIEQQEQAIQRKNYDELARLDMRFHEYICIRAEHSRLLKAWYEQHAQCQMLLNLRFRRLASYTPETVPVDHNRILKAIEDKEPGVAIALTHEISERVAQDCAGRCR